MKIRRILMSLMIFGILALFGTLSVSAIEDFNAPTLKSIKVSDGVSNSSIGAAIKVNNGSTLTVSVEAEDESGLADEAHALYILKQGNAEIAKEIVLNKVSDNLYQTTLNIDETFKNGMWNLSYIILKDSAENVIAIYDKNLHNYQDINQADDGMVLEDLSVGDFEVANDAIPQFTGITVDKTNVKSPDVVNISLLTTGQATNLAPEANVCYTLVNGTKPMEKELTLALGTDGKYVGQFNIDDSILNGTWKANYAVFEDLDGNVVATYNSNVNPGVGQDLSTGDFEVANDAIPQFTGITADKANVKSPDVVNITLSTTGQAANLAPEANVCYTLVNGQKAMEKELTLKLGTDGKYVGQFDIDDSILSGTWKVNYAVFEDLDGNVIATYNSNVNPGVGQDLSKGDFVVEANPIPEFVGITVDKTNVKSPDVVNITLTTTGQAANLALEANICYTLVNGVKAMEKEITLKLGTDGKYVGQFNIDDSILSGTWKVNYAVFEDLDGNVVATYNSKVNPGVGKDLSTGDFTVAGAVIPALTGISVDKTEYGYLDNITVTATTTGTEANLAPEANVCYTATINGKTVDKEVTLTLNSDNKYIGIFNIDEMAASQWEVKYITFEDLDGDVIVTYNSKVYEGIGVDLSSGDFSYKTPDITAECAATSQILSNGKTVEIPFKIKNNSSELKNATIILAIYDNENRLVDIVYSETPIKSQEEINLVNSLTIPSTGTYTVKAFIWDSMNGMKPIGKVRQFWVLGK